LKAGVLAAVVVLVKTVVHLLVVLGVAVELISKKLSLSQQVKPLLILLVH
jgi:uncharacterized membrane protein YphA (DoxX/SURF4 family)